MQERRSSCSNVTCEVKVRDLQQRSEGRTESSRPGREGVAIPDPRDKRRKDCAFAVEHCWRPDAERSVGKQRRPWGKWAQDAAGEVGRATENMCCDSCRLSLVPRLASWHRLTFKRFTFIDCFPLVSSSFPSRLSLANCYGISPGIITANYFTGCHCIPGPDLNTMRTGPSDSHNNRVQRWLSPFPKSCSWGTQRLRNVPPVTALEWKGRHPSLKNALLSPCTAGAWSLPATRKVEIIWQREAVRLACLLFTSFLLPG